jgi:hypothetical protein
MRQRAQDLEGFGERADLLAAKDGANGVNSGSGELGEIGEGGCLTLPPSR